MVEITEGNYGKDHAEVGKILYNLANANRGLNQMFEAQNYASRAYRIFETKYGAGYPYALEAKLLMQNCQELLSKPNAAMPAAFTFSHQSGNEPAELQKILMRIKTDKDKTLPSVEVVFRRATAVGSKADVKFLAKHVKDINQQDDNPASKRTPKIS